MIIKRIFSTGKDGGVCGFEVVFNKDEPHPYTGDVLVGNGASSLVVTKFEIIEDFFEDLFYLETRAITNNPSDEFVGVVGNTLHRRSFQPGPIVVKDPIKVFTYVMPD